MSATPDTWELVNDEREPGPGGWADCYTDYEHYVPDVNGYGVKLRVSIQSTRHDVPVRATLSTLADSDTEEYGHTEMPLPVDVAVAMTGHKRLEPTP